MAKEGLRKWFSRNKGKGWVDCKTGKPCGRKKGEKRKGYLQSSGRSSADIQLVGQQWLNAHLQQKRRKDLNELAGKMVE